MHSKVWDEITYPFPNFVFQMTISVFIPADAIVGSYNAAVKLFYRNADKKDQVKRHDLDDEITVLFNPWCSGKWSISIDLMIDKLKGISPTRALCRDEVMIRKLLALYWPFMWREAFGHWRIYLPKYL